MSCRIIAVTTVLMLACGIAPRSSRAQEAPATVSDSAEGLKSQIDAILESAKNNQSEKNRDPKRFSDLVSELRIAENSNWFTSQFGDDIGAKLATEYSQSWNNFQETLSRSFLGAAESKPKKTSVTVFGASSPFAQANMTSIRQSAKSDLRLYEVTLSTGRGKDLVPGLYVYADGAFRVLNWATLYKLPNVKRQRIRVAGNVEQPKLVHQVNPVPPPDAFKNHVQGTVQLHVIIDVDGNVEQVNVVSGPSELAAAATDAVKQWRYRPTTLNGDPIEVDTTVSVNFTLGG